MTTTYTLQPNRLLTLTQRTRCIACKHNEDEAYILPSKQHGEINPSSKWLYHHQDTHGIPNDLMLTWLIKYCYADPQGRELIDDSAYVSWFYGDGL